MSAARPEPQPLLLPAEAAKRLRCSEWWVKEQARKGRIPYTRIGGGYRFTEEHIAAIIRLFQHQPNEIPAPVVATPQRPRESQPTTASVIELTARLPKRARLMDQRQAA